MTYLATPSILQGCHVLKSEPLTIPMTANLSLLYSLHLRKSTYRSAFLLGIRLPNSQTTNPSILHLELSSRAYFSKAGLTHDQVQSHHSMTHESRAAAAPLMIAPTQRSTPCHSLSFFRPPTSYHHAQPSQRRPSRTHTSDTH
jgi:hypothetical protein